VIVTVAGLLFYMLLTGAASSIVRATIMGCVIVIGTAMERRTDIYNSICVAAVIVLLIDPLQLFDVGFQLSFAAVLSIVMLYPILDAAIRQIPESWEEFKILEPVWKVFAVSLAAQLGTLPFTAFYFERFSIVSLLANVAVVPLVGLNLILGCVTIAAEFLGSWLAASYAALNELLVSILLGFVRRAASVPFAAVETYGFGILSGAFYYAALLGIINIRNARLVKIAGFSMLLIAASGVARSILTEPRPMQLLMLDVGQGDALLLRFPNGANVLVDAGPRTFGYDAGKRVLVPFLSRQGITRLDAVVLSHPHSDHIGGLEAVLSMVQVAAIYEADTVIASRMHAEMRRVAAERGVELRTVGTGDEISPDPNARLYVVHPAPGQDRFENLNNNSLVLKLQYGGSEALLCGDAELEAEEIMGARYRFFLGADMLKTGHHGSSTSSSDDFLHGITPKFAIISVGAANKFKHPSPRVVERLRSGGTRVLRTDLEGALLFTTDGTTWKRIDWR
ncbi:MAG TPA: DNA internalization-related competence protein ComEC/Rec2, partial [Bacteroidota bacterium]